MLNIDPLRSPSTISGSEIGSPPSSSLELITDEQYRNDLTAVQTTRHPSIQARSQAFMEIALKNPEVRTEYEKLDALKSKFPNCFDTIKNSSWNALCTERGAEMTLPRPPEEISLEEFRTLLNAALDNVAIAIGKNAGCTEAKFSACGTKSYLSDVDNTIQGENLSPTDANIYTAARHEVYTNLFEGGDSGVQLDTEIYIPHPAMYNTKGKLSTSHEAHLRYVACEKANVALQYYMSLHSNPAEYEKVKQNYLSNIQDPEHKAGMEEIFTQVEALMSSIELRISKEMLMQNGIDTFAMNPEEIMAKAEAIAKENPKAYKEARSNVIWQIRAELGNKIAKIDQDIDAVAKQVSAGLAGTAKLDDLYNLRNEVFSIMNILQDEGTNSQSEGKVTLFKEGGQIHAKAKDEAKKAFTKMVEKQKSAIRYLARQDSHNMLEIAVKEVRKDLTPKNFEQADPEMLSIASDEETAQFNHSFLDANREVFNDELAMRSLGNSKLAKYAHRATSNSFKALQGQKASRELFALKHKAKLLMNTSENLVRCMRRDFLGEEAAVHYLEVALGPSDDPIKRAADLRKVVAFDEERIATPLDRLREMAQKMKNLNLITSAEYEELCLEKMTYRTNPQIRPLEKLQEIRQILEERAGFSYPVGTKEFEISEKHHKDAILYTCERLNLNTTTTVHRFYSDINELSIARENLFIKRGWIPKVTVETARKLNFAGLVENI